MVNPKKNSPHDSFNFAALQAAGSLEPWQRSVKQVHSLISRESFEGPELFSPQCQSILFQVSQGGWHLNVGWLSPAKIRRRAEAFSIRGMLTATLKQSLTPDQAWGSKFERRSGATGNGGGLSEHRRLIIASVRIPRMGTRFTGHKS